MPGEQLVAPRNASGLHQHRPTKKLSPPKTGSIRDSGIRTARGARARRGSVGTRTRSRRRVDATSAEKAWPRRRDRAHVSLRRSRRGGVARISFAEVEGGSFGAELGGPGHGHQPPKALQLTVQCREHDRPGDRKPPSSGGPILHLRMVGVGRQGTEFRGRAAIKTATATVIGARYIGAKRGDYKPCSRPSNRQLLSPEATRRCFNRPISCFGRRLRAVRISVRFR